MTEFEFRLLGPLEVWRAGRQVPVRGPKLRSLLAMLLLHAGEAVSTDRLIDALWGEQPPAAAANALQARVASLRRALGEPARDFLETRSPGYLLTVSDDALDIACFERLVASASAVGADDPAAAAGLLRQALDLWHGPALAEFVFEPFAHGEAARLEELRLAALEDRLDADLELGRHPQVVPELEALLVEHPLRERFAALLMLALYRCDRQADASRVYHATRAALVEELGMEPGAPLRELHQRVLDHDPTLARTAETIPAGGGARDRDGRPAHNLPVELTSFIGRERELEELAKLLPIARLVTLTGAGGSGKTRLALRLARAALDDYVDGVWLVELGALADPALVPKSVAVTLGLRQEVGSLIEALGKRVGTARLLVVLDNCEHLVGACAELTHALLSVCPNLWILATSREPLKVTGEVTWPVPGLGLPGSDRAAPPDQYTAIRLFAERAAAVKPGFALDTHTTSAVVDLCERLDGMPLAIELAAARLQTLTPREVLGRLDDRFRLLSGGRRDALPRQHTLRATVEWSHDLLARPERSLFRRLSVFAGGWLLADAEQVCADDDLPSEEVLDVLGALVAKSLVVAEAGSGDATRYRLLETLREYARERLRADGEEDSVRSRHFRHFRELSEHAHEQKLLSGSDAGIASMTGQLENLRAGLAFARDADAHGLMRLATAMEHLWLAGNLAEGRRWLEEALAAATEPTLERARALHVAVTVASLQQDHARARQFGKECLVLSASLGDVRGEAWARQSLGFIEWEAGHHNAAVDHLKRSLAMHQARGDRLGMCRSLIFLATAKTYIPASKREGRAQLQRGLDVARELGDAWGEGWAEAFLGFADIDAGEPGLAAARFRRAATATALGPIRAAGIDGLATLAVDDDPLRTIRLLGAATAHRQRHGGRPVPHFGRMTERFRTRAERLLDPDAAEQAWNEGLQMSTDAAVAYALSHEPPSSHPSSG